MSAPNTIKKCAVKRASYISRGERGSKPKLDHLLKLPVPERIKLAMALWDSIAEPELQDQLPLTDAQKAELDCRLTEHDRDPSRGIPWEEVQRRLRPYLPCIL